MDFGVESKRLAIEVIAKLVNIKQTMAELILKPAGITSDIYQSLLYKSDEVTGYTLSKRQIAPLILEVLEQRGSCQSVVRNIIEIAANWSSFHLASDEYEARAVVQKARELMGNIELWEEKEARQRELARKEALAHSEKERAEILRKQLELLLMMFDTLAVSEEVQRRGYLLQDLLNRLFDLYEIPVVNSFTRNGGAEQIDGAFKLEGWFYVVECRWRKKLADIRELDGLQGAVRRSGKQTMGLFLSINGWSSNVPDLLKQDPEKSIILMEGFDLRTVLTGETDLKEFILAKLAHLNLKTEPFLSAKDYLNL